MAICLRSWRWGGLITLSILFICTGLGNSSLSVTAAADQRGTGSTAAVQGTWLVLEGIPFGRAAPGVAVLNGKIHVVGGYDFTESPAYEIYNPQTGSWSNKPSLPVARSDLVLVAFGGKLYAIGGWNNSQGGPMGHNHQFDPVLNQWIAKKGIPTPVSGAGGVVFNNRIYILGGYESATLGESDLLQIYNPANDTWSSGSPMPSGRSQFDAIVWNGKFYAIGGNREVDVDVTKVVEIYDPVADSWSPGPALPEKRTDLAVAEMNGLIYAVGGSDTWVAGAPGPPTATGFVLDPVSGIWSAIFPMPTPRSRAGAAVVGGLMYVLGGEGFQSSRTANEAYGSFQPQYLPFTLANRRIGP